MEFSHSDEDPFEVKQDDPNDEPPIEVAEFESKESRALNAEEEKLNQSVRVISQTELIEDDSKLMRASVKGRSSVSFKNTSIVSPLKRQLQMLSKQRLELIQEEG